MLVREAKQRMRPGGDGTPPAGCRFWPSSLELKSPKAYRPGKHRVAQGSEGVNAGVAREPSIRSNPRVTSIKGTINGMNARRPRSLNQERESQSEKAGETDEEG